MAVGSNPTLDSLVAVRYTSPGRPEPCEGNLVAVAGSCGGVMVKHPWPLLEISLSDFRGLATLNINTYLPTYLVVLLESLLGIYAKYFMPRFKSFLLHMPEYHHGMKRKDCFHKKLHHKELFILKGGQSASVIDLSQRGSYGLILNKFTHFYYILYVMPW